MPFLLLLTVTPTLARDLSSLDPPYPRIANCYGAGLGWQSWEKGAEYWSKLDLFIGGGYDLHYDWESPRWEKVLATVAQNVAHVREVNPTALVLPYVDVVEGPDNPKLPAQWWDLRNGERWSGWPGMYRIKTSLPEVLQYNLDQVRTQVLGRDCFDGVFYDCWSPDPWLLPRTAALRDGKAVVMINDWNLPRTGFDSLNGCLAEDELNRVIEGQVDFEDFLARYLRWCRESRRPVVTTIVCHPRNMDMDPWRWSKVPWPDRAKQAETLKTSDPQTMRFGLTTTLLGDGYFAYDCANLGRGQWWWYPEFDAPLGHPKGPATRCPDGTWQRAFDGGLVVANGSSYDAVVNLNGRYRDLSTGRVAARFTIRQFDGRLLLPTTDPLSPGEDAPPRLTSAPPASPEAVALDDGTIVCRSPGGLELRLSPTGELRQILLRGRRICSGGWPVVAAPPLTIFRVENPGPPECSSAVDEARVSFQGRLTEGDQRVAFVEMCSVRADNRFTLHFDFTAETDLNLRMWRHYFFLPVSDYAGATVRSGDTRLVLPPTLAADTLLPATKQLEVTAKDWSLTVESSLPLSLVDHRKWGSDDYLLAGYPVSGEVKAGTHWSVEITTTITATRR